MHALTRTWIASVVCALAVAATAEAAIFGEPIQLNSNAVEDHAAANEPVVEAVVEIAQMYLGVDEMDSSTPFEAYFKYGRAGVRLLRRNLFPSRTPIR